MPDGYAPSVPVFLTALAERTTTARLGSYIYILPLHHPLQLAQETAVIDQMSEGRLEVMVGAGHARAEFRAFGMSPKTRPSRMEEGFTLLKKGWSERPFSFSGRHYEFDQVSVYPEPAQRPHPPLWVAATAPAAAGRAGRHGANLAASSIDPAVFEAYLAGRREARNGAAPHRSPSRGRSQSPTKPPKEYGLATERCTLSGGTSIAKSGRQWATSRSPH
jgi:alkanesulfonate monooxygenase SsuD/methylene tetrahydromethanopterin reductase-like flavin-dependent oxidoreductase (luciferase family)